MRVYLESGFTNVKFLEAGCGTMLSVLVAWIYGFRDIVAYDQDVEVYETALDHYKETWDKMDASLQEQLLKPKVAPLKKPLPEALKNAVLEHFKDLGPWKPAVPPAPGQQAVPSQPEEFHMLPKPEVLEKLALGYKVDIETAE